VSRVTPDDAVRLALQGKSTAAIAEELQVHRGTVWAWLSSPGVAGKLADARRAVVDAVTLRLQELAHDALDLLAEVMADANVPPGVRVRAACELLDRAGIAGAPAVTVTVAPQGVDVAPLLRRLTERIDDSAPRV
jgi:orotate phosphoribosyltransferase-like protein